jgi:hypothetical protein
MRLLLQFYYFPHTFTHIVDQEEVTSTCVDTNEKLAVTTVTADVYRITIVEQPRYDHSYCPEYCTLALTGSNQLAARMAELAIAQILHW